MVSLIRITTRLVGKDIFLNKVIRTLYSTRYTVASIIKVENGVDLQIISSANGINPEDEFREFIPGVIGIENFKADNIETFKEVAHHYTRH